jgi:exonuclease 3'-5' domain-containing protein 1
VTDFQLRELASTTHGSRTFLAGLANCIKHDSTMTLAARQRAATVKDTGLQLYAPETGGSYAVFDERPLKMILLEYCVQDMVHMPELWDVYQRRIDGFRKVLVK